MLSGQLVGQQIPVKSMIFTDVKASLVEGQSTCGEPKKHAAQPRCILSCGHVSMRPYPGYLPIISITAAVAPVSNIT